MACDQSWAVECERRDERWGWNENFGWSWIAEFVATGKKNEHASSLWVSGSVCLLPREAWFDRDRWILFSVASLKDRARTGLFGAKRSYFPVWI